MTSSIEVILENFLSYFVILIFVFVSLYVYIKAKKKASKVIEKKIIKAKEMGLYEPVSLHPVVNPEICIGSGACIKACPEKDILGIVNGQAKTVNASRCVGHGACFHACPMDAISLFIGTEKRGVDLPHVNADFKTNINGIYIAGELGGMGLIKNAVEQGRQAVENISKSLKPSVSADYDITIIGAGPAGISGTLAAVKNNLKYITLEQDSLGGTVFSFPRAKIVMTSPMFLPIYGKVKLTSTTKTELLNLWREVIVKNNIIINENEKVLTVQRRDEIFEIETVNRKFTSKSVLLAVGRRGTPRKLGIKGEEKEKVYYRLLEPEIIHNQNILVVGGGDSAIESALLLADENNKVTLSYRSASFSRIKPGNAERIEKASSAGIINVVYNSSPLEIKDNSVILKLSETNENVEIDNNIVYVFAGGELPNVFLEKIGISVTKKFGEAILKH
ncbi:MAG: NAD(P)-binding domain-containing protein [bacterium]